MTNLYDIAGFAEVDFSKFIISSTCVVFHIFCITWLISELQLKFNLHLQEKCGMHKNFMYKKKITTIEDH